MCITCNNFIIFLLYILIVKLIYKSIQVVNNNMIFHHYFYFSLNFWSSLKKVNSGVGIQCLWMFLILGYVDFPSNCSKFRQVLTVYDVWILQSGQCIVSYRIVSNTSLFMCKICVLLYVPAISMPYLDLIAYCLLI